MARLVTVDWVQVLVELIEHGQSLITLADVSGIHRNTLRGYLEAGSHPPHWRGEILIGVWCQVLKRTRDDVPMTALYLAPRVATSRQTPVREKAMA